MAIKLSTPEIKWFANEFNSGRTVEEMAIDTGFSKQNIKRALAEAGVCYLTWYKTKEEDAMLKLLKQYNIDTVEQLKEAI